MRKVVTFSFLIKEGTSTS